MAEEVEESSAVTGRRRPAEGETHTHTDTQLSYNSCKNTRLLTTATKTRQLEASVLLTRLKES